MIDTAVEELRGRIETEQWPVGTRIPPEPALVDLLGVGRNTVREAVQSLVHAGLLERRQGSGTYVLSRSELAVTMGRQIADARQRDVVEVRRALEVEAARLAALRRTPDEVRVVPIEGLNPPRVNGIRVVPEGQSLAIGDVLEIAGAKLELIAPMKRPSA